MASRLLPNVTDRTVQATLFRESLGLFARRAFVELNTGRTLSDNWHIDAMTTALEGAVRGRIKRLLITVPPRHLKSHLASISLPAWVHARDPGRRIITASYSSDLARKFSRDGRALVQSRWYSDTFPRSRLDPAKMTETEIQTRDRGFRFATSVGGTLTGRGGDLIIVDDAMKPEDAQSKAARTAVKEWFTGTLLSRLDDKALGAIIVVMQRLHVDDLAGFLLASGDWHHVNIPAISDIDLTYDLGPFGIYRRLKDSVIDPAREPRENLEALKIEMGSTAFSAQYLQAPIPAEGQLVKWSWFGTYPSLPPSSQWLRWVISWDTAIATGSSNDYSVGIVMLETLKRDVFIVDLIRDRLESPDLVRRIRAEAQQRPGAATLIEATGSGISFVQQLQRDGGVNAVPVPAIGSKESRLQLCAPKIEAKRVLLPEEAPWLGDLHDELVSFPSGAHDDQVDALSQGLNYIEQHRTYTANELYGRQQWSC